MSESLPPSTRWVDEFPALQRSVLDACKTAGVPLIAAENVYGYGDTAATRYSDTEMKPVSAKGAVRAQMWAELRHAHASGAVPTAAVRASDFFGPGVVDSVYGSRFFNAIAKGRQAEVLGSPTARHSIPRRDSASCPVISPASPPGDLCLYR